MSLMLHGNIKDHVDLVSRSVVDVQKWWDNYFEDNIVSKIPTQRKEQNPTWIWAFDILQ
jgi:hypothetical protein